MNCVVKHGIISLVLEILRPNPSSHVMDTSSCENLYGLYASEMGQITKDDNHPFLSAVSVTGGEQPLI